MNTEPSLHTIDFNGLSLAYTRWPGSNPDLTPVIFVHGGSANQYWWHPAIELLDTDREYIAMDISGHGRSGWIDEYTFPQWVDEVHYLASTLYPQGCYLVGHSLGGALSFSAAAAGYPAKAIVLIDINPATFTSKKLPSADSISAVKRFSTRDAAVSAVVDHKETWPPELAQRIGQDSIHLVDGAWQMWRDPRVVMARLVPTPLEAVNTIPVKFLLGGESTYKMHERPSLQPDALPNNMTVQVLPGLGHDLLMESPERTASALSEFFLRCDG